MVRWGWKQPIYLVRCDGPLVVLREGPTIDDVFASLTWASLEGQSVCS